MRVYYEIHAKFTFELLGHTIEGSKLIELGHWDKAEWHGKRDNTFSTKEDALKFIEEYHEDRGVFDWSHILLIKELISI